jgi:hypothetical protein
LVKAAFLKLDICFGISSTSRGRFLIWAIDSQSPFGYSTFMQTVLSNLSVAQLRRAITIKEKIEALENELAHVLDAAPAASAALPMVSRKKRTMSAAARAKIAAGQRARWAKRREAQAFKAIAKPASKPYQGLKAALRAKRSAIAKARRAKAKTTWEKAFHAVPF